MAPSRRAEVVTLDSKENFPNGEPTEVKDDSKSEPSAFISDHSYARPIAEKQTQYNSQVRPYFPSLNNFSPWYLTFPFSIDSFQHSLLTSTITVEHLSYPLPMSLQRLRVWNLLKGSP